MTSENDGEMESLREEIGRLREEVARLSPPLPILLKLRGFTIYKKKPLESPLVPDNKYIKKYYELLNRYSFRLFLRDIIKHQEGFSVEDVARFAARHVTETYMDILTEMEMIETGDGLCRLKRRPVRSFGPTLEWFVAEIFRREYKTEALWGVRFKRPNVGGDYDVIAKISDKIIYSEVKSSPPKQVYQSEIAAFYDRVEDLSPEIAVFLMDTELRMKDKIVPMFEEEFHGRGRRPRVIRMEKELFHISNSIFIINSKGGIAGNLEKVMRWSFLYNKER